jgi:predicted negative regulator of RcsB-dependent stress response
VTQQQSSRKQLLKEPDEFISTSQHVWLWVTEHRTRAMAIAGAVAGAVLVAVLAKALVENSREKRSAAVSAAVARFGQAPEGKLPADLLPELAGLAQKYAGSPSGTIARFFEAGASAAGGDADKARRIYQELRAGDKGGAEIAPLSGVALAYLDLAQGQDDAALASFQALLADKGAAIPRAQIKMEIAALHEKRGKTAEALEVYREVVASHPDGSWAAVAKERVRALAGKSPAAS